MKDLQIEIEAARASIAEGQKHIRLQRQILGHLREVGACTKVAEQVLAQFEVRLAQDEAREASLAAALAAMPQSPRAI
ncbi:hypothetical protein E2493_01850 [Sphingomonas parva]|uniref:Uncharacterized protein n=1 Tax=Sphingomonas parva TaxID=2555898 RepID=A0A4Y8ZZ62_9SPHN|nr:hypothetical protein [Sphingomonas parva]TFI60016.1 hypothetical protein E2493_01850 [Sphingomonas parva]